MFEIFYSETLKRTTVPEILAGVNKSSPEIVCNGNHFPFDEYIADILIPSLFVHRCDSVKKSSDQNYLFVCNGPILYKEYLFDESTRKELTENVSET